MGNSKQMRKEGDGRTRLGVSFLGIIDGGCRCRCRLRFVVLNWKAGGTDTDVAEMLAFFLGRRDGCVLQAAQQGMSRRGRQGKAGEAGFLTQDNQNAATTFLSRCLVSPERRPGKEVESVFSISMSQRRPGHWQARRMRMRAEQCQNRTGLSGFIPTSYRGTRPYVQEESRSPGLLHHSPRSQDHTRLSPRIGYLQEPSWLSPVSGL